MAGVVRFLVLALAVFAVAAPVRGAKSTDGSYAGSPSAAEQDLAVEPQFTAIPDTAFADLHTGRNFDLGDYDDDGDLDVLIEGTDRVRVYRNDGGGTFADIGAVLVGSSVGDVAWGDYNSDGKLDILVAGSGPVEVYKGDGAGTFTEISSLGEGLVFPALAWGDSDNDGDQDYLYIGGDLARETSYSRLFRNDGEGVFVELDVELAPASMGDVEWGDYDNDGDLDLLLTGTEFSYLGASEVYRNDGANVFTPIHAGLGGRYFSTAAWGDYDNDGDLDILQAGVVAFDGGDWATNLYRNEGSDTFVEVEVGVVDIENGGAAWGDYDNDGDLDLAIAGSGPISEGGVIARIYRNDGGDNFTDIEAPLIGATESDVEWADYDNDGDLDLFVSGRDANNVRSLRIYRNNAAVPNVRPVAPKGLVADRVDGGIEFRWDASEDEESPRAALTYALRIGTGPGLEDVRPAGASGSGYRKVAGRGSTYHSTRWVLNGEHPGALYWSVQAVDNGGAGSGFATEQTIGAVSDVPGPALPKAYALDAPMPNPFNPTTTIGYELPRASVVSLGVYDVAGRKVRDLIRAELIAAGRWTVVWHGDDLHGRPVAAGVYFCRLQAEGHEDTKRMVLVK